jgi:phage terminase large subunit-like protein
VANVPPGTGKSLFTSVFWPCWEWARDPTIRWIFISYDERLSTRDSMKCRNIIESKWYRDRWPNVQLKGDAKLKTYYETTAGGYRMATSVTGHGVGEHPDRICLDDPNDVGVSSGGGKIKSGAADREAVIELHTQKMGIRGVARKARRVLIQQRLHVRDLTGWILENEPNDWCFFILPMRYEPNRMATTPIGWNDWRTEPGELLMPDLFDEPKVAMMEARLGVYGASGQLQQRPAPREGGFFKEAWFANVQDFWPGGCTLVRAWDKASTESGGCCTCGVLMAKDIQGRYYICHVVKGQWSPYNRWKQMKATAETDQRLYGHVSIYVEEEGGSAGKDANLFDARNLDGFAVHFDRPGSRGSKDQRAEPWAGQLEAGNVVVCRNPSRPWMMEIRGEIVYGAAVINSYVTNHCLYPKGEFLDDIDASSLGNSRLALPQPDRTGFTREAVARACRVAGDLEPPLC